MAKIKVEDIDPKKTHEGEEQASELTDEQLNSVGVVQTPPLPAPVEISIKLGIKEILGL